MIYLSLPRVITLVTTPMAARAVKHGAIWQDIESLADVMRNTKCFLRAFDQIIVWRPRLRQLYFVGSFGRRLLSCALTSLVRSLSSEDDGSGSIARMSSRCISSFSLSQSILRAIPSSLKYS